MPALLTLCAKASVSIRDHYRSPGSPEYRSKGDETPLTQADLAADDILQSGLHELTPEMPVLSEESPPDILAQRRAWERFWLLDPLDGTREFLNRTGQFTINLALIEGGSPSLGIVYMPLEDIAYAGIPGDGAGLFSRRKDGVFSRRKIACRPLSIERPLVLLASSRHRGRRLANCMEWLERNNFELERRNSGAAIKFCQLAAGEGDLYPRFSRCCEWDTAAGQALVEAAGGAVLGMDGRPLQYNQRDTLYSPHFYAVASADEPVWQRLLAARVDRVE